MFFKNSSRRNFFHLLGLGGATIVANAQFARLEIGKTSGGVRVLATINPQDSGWELLQSKDGGKAWSIISEAPVIVGAGRLRWDIATESAAIFRLRLDAGSVIQLPGNLFFGVPSGQTLFEALTSLRTSTLLSFHSVYNEIQKGQFITEFNGVSGKWVYEVNNLGILVGSSDYELQKKDEIKWKLV